LGLLCEAVAKAESSAMPTPPALARLASLAPTPEPVSGLPGLGRPALPLTLVWLVLLALALALTVLWVWLLVDTLRRERGRARLFWAALVLLAFWPGALAYCLLRWRQRPGAPPLSRGGPAVELWRALTGRAPPRCSSCRYDQGTACALPERGRAGANCPDYQPLPAEKS
jgi:hypothetical protein